MVRERQSDVNSPRILTLPKVISLPTFLPTSITQTETSNENYNVAWNKNINLTAAENLPVKFILSDDDNGYVEYGSVVNGQRRGLKARITPAMLNTGSAVTYEFPFLGHHYGSRLGRVNLLARILGGNGKEPRNVIPLPFNHSQLPKLDAIEKEIVAHVSMGNNAEVLIRVDYTNHPASCALFPSAIIYVIKKIRGILAKVQEEKVFEMPIYWSA